MGFIGVLRQIPSESVGAIHESPASKLGFIELLRYGNPAKITYKPVGTDVLGGPEANDSCYQRIGASFFFNILPLVSDSRGRLSLQVCALILLGASIATHRQIKI